MLKLVGVLLIILAVYAPVSVFAGLPPFGIYNETVYVYEEIADESSVYSQPGIKEPRGLETVKSTIPLDDPETYGLRLNYVDNNYVNDNPWFFGSMPIFFGFLIGGIVCIVVGGKRRA